MGKGSGNGTTRGERRRNARRERLRGLLPRDGAVIGIDLAEDKQALAVIDYDVRVLARKTVRVKAFRLGDLKPSNVMLAEDGPRVIDFGISRAAEATSMIRAGFVIGSPGFMSPEQAARRRARARARGRSRGRGSA
jgi:hypothetical protein